MNVTVVSRQGRVCEFFLVGEQLSFTHYLQRLQRCKPKDDEIIPGERLTKGMTPGGHVPIRSRIWLDSRVLATHFRLSFHENVHGER